MTIQQKSYTVADFFQWVERPENADQRWQLIGGQIVAMPPSSPTHSKVGARFARFLGAFVDERDLGHVLGADGGYILADGEVRIPDVSYIAKARVPDLLHLAPDLAVEVISPSESPRAVLDKIALYLGAGTRLVWAAYPDERVVDVWWAGENGTMQVQKFDIDGTLDGGDVLPGFRLAVKDIFQGI
jgi:Uma2 family endonuclease